MGKVIIALLLMSACVSIPKSEPLGFTHKTITHKNNPAFLFDVCKKHPGPIIFSPSEIRYDNVVCDRSKFRTNLDVVIKQHYELKGFSNSHRSLVEQSMVHDDANGLRRAILQNEINKLHLRVFGVTLGSVLIILALGLAL